MSPNILTQTRELAMGKFGSPTSVAGALGGKAYHLLYESAEPGPGELEGLNAYIGKLQNPTGEVLLAKVKERYGNFGAFAKINGLKERADVALANPKLTPTKFRITVILGVNEPYHPL